MADIVGDSLALARKAAEVDADVIVLAGVHFMAETAKLLNPTKTVLIPTWAPAARWRIRSRRKMSPCFGRPIRRSDHHLCQHIGSRQSASDICCTSGNAKKVVESLGVPRVIMIPDEYLAPQRRPRDRCRDHRLARPLRGA